MTITKTIALPNFTRKNLLTKVIFSLMFAILFIPAFPQTAQITSADVYYNTSASPYYCAASTPQGSAKSFYTTGILPVDSTNPADNSSLIQFDKPFTWTGSNGVNGYPNHCLQICIQVQCSTILSSEVPTPSYPIQSTTFEIFKFLEQGNPYDEKATPPIRTIQLYPTSGSAYKCAGYKYGGNPNAPTILFDIGDGAPTVTCNSSSTAASNCNCVNNGQAMKMNDVGEIQGNTCYIEDKSNILTFCAGWDGSYNFDSEFAKTNGFFGFRATINTDFQPDPIISESPISITNTVVFPGMNQMPINVDVTNVHSVRTSPTAVGFIDPVPAQPYYIKYRLSKDAYTTINIFDASAAANVNTSATMSPALSRILINNEPRLGERSPNGGQVDGVLPLVEVEPWDGRDNTGRLLPAGNYLIDIGATSEDRWGVDPALNKQYQLSLDPLKITDRIEIGLNKTSTGYAALSYLLSEASTVYFQVYSPGTTFASVYTTAAGTGTAPTASNGVLLYSNIEQKPSRTTTFTKWDGRCLVTGGCTFGGNTYNYGDYLPDGDYVYVIWAEIPYQTAYTNMAGTTFDAVKSRMYHNGILPINRGDVDIAIQPVGYATVGSSPVAYGVDPFLFKYSISRDAPVTVTVKNTANTVVKTIISNEVQVAQQMNQYTWDGIDDYGRFVSPGTYSLVVTTYDPINPTITYSQTALFPVDLFRVVDVNTLPLLDETNSQAVLNYSLSKVMQVNIFVYDKSVVLPNDKTAPWPPGIIADQNTGQLAIGGSVTAANNMPVKTFKGVKPGDGMNNVEMWDGTKQSDSSYLSDGQYPFVIVAAATAPGTIYYDNYSFGTLDNGSGCNAAYTPPSGTPTTSTVQCGYGTLWSTDHVTGFINIARGPLYFLKDSIIISPTYPKLVHSTETIRVPPYTIEFTPSRAAQIDVDILSRDGKDCYGKTLPAGTTTQPVCRTLRGTNFYNNGFQNAFPGNAPSRIFWDGKDDRGIYCANGAYTVRLRGNAYPLNVNAPSYSGTEAVCSESSPSNPVITADMCTNAQLAGTSRIKCADGSNGVIVGIAPNRYITCPTNYEATETRLLEGNLFQVFDVWIEDIAKRGDSGKFTYQTSVPMKVAIQIFKPGTYISDYHTGEVSNGSFSKVMCEETATPGSGLGICSGASLGNPGSLCTAAEYGEITGNTPNRRVVCVAPNRQNSTERDLIVKSIVGFRPDLYVEEPWDGRDYAMQEVPDGFYPYRFVTTTQNNSSHIDSFFGDIDDISYIADWNSYGVMAGEFAVARGDGQFVCNDWKKTVIFFPNPFRENTGKIEITKAPVPGDVTIRIYNIAGDLVRTGGYKCYDQNNNALTMDSSLYIQPDNTIRGAIATGEPNLRNAAVRCEWDKKNDHGKTVARGVYLALVSFKATGGGKEYCQKVVKIVIP